MVAGGFYDGKSVIVEPLCNPLHMLMGVKREGALAQVLYALHEYVSHPSRGCLIPSLNRSLSKPATKSFPPGVPRLYHSCHLSDSTVEAQITFESLFSASLHHPMLNANLQGIKDQVLVKITSRPYGTSVHRFLADRGFAPKLIGVSTLDSESDYSLKGPTVYVMEKLDPTFLPLPH